MTPAPNDPGGISAARRRDQLCDAFEEAWLRGERPRLENSLAGVPETEQHELVRELLRLDLQYRCRAGENPRPHDYSARFSQFEAEIRAVFDETAPVVSPPPDPRPSSHRFQAGDLIAGRYRIVSPLGKGGMGEVYRGDDVTLGVSVALKFLPPDRAADPIWVAKFKQEVALALRVTHPNVCRVHDLGDADGVSFIAMQYVDGKSLDALSRMSGRLAPEQVVNYARQLCDGLASVHDAGLLHRDLKPGNVLLDGHGRLLLADFGLAAVTADLAGEEIGAGTLLYMAPEQLTGAEVTDRSDLFALGLILYELTTGQRPFPGATRADLLRQHAGLIPPLPSVRVPGIDPRLDKAIARCLHRDPSQRPRSAQELKETLPELSPRQTAEIGGTGRLRPLIALGLLAAALFGIYLNAWSADRTMAFRQVPRLRAPDLLRDDAKEIAHGFGYQAPIKSEAGILEWDMDLIQQQGTWPGAHSRAAPPIYYWYRSSPQPLVPVSRITPNDPAMVVPGMVCVMLDPQGKLIEFHGVPARLTSPPSQNQKLSVAMLLDRAGLDPDETHYRKTSPPVRRPPVFADEAWSLFPTDGSSYRLDIATCDGQLVYFRASEPFANGEERNDRAEGQMFSLSAFREDATGVVGTVLLLGAMIGAFPVAWRNWQRRRTDVPGAIRIGILYLALSMTAWLLAAVHSLSFVAEMSHFMNILGAAAFAFLLLVVLYLALEPYLRQRWPERLSSWNRLLTGQFRDPLVGRDVLIGIAIGSLFAMVPKLTASALGTPLLFTHFYEPFTPAVPPGVLFYLAADAVVRTVAGFGLLILLLLLLRHEWLTWVVLVVLLTLRSQSLFVTFPKWQLITLVGCGALAILVVLTIARFGLVTLLLAQFTSLVIFSMPVTTNPEPWYAGLTIVSVAVLIIFAAFGCFTSLGGLRAIPEEL